VSCPEWNVPGAENTLTMRRRAFGAHRRPAPARTIAGVDHARTRSDRRWMLLGRDHARDRDETAPSALALSSMFFDLKPDHGELGRRVFSNRLVGVEMCSARTA